MRVLRSRLGPPKQSRVNPVSSLRLTPRSFPVVTFLCLYLCRIARYINNWIMVVFTVNSYDCTDGKRSIRILAYLIAIEFEYSFVPSLRFYNCLCQNRWHRADRESA